MKDYTCKGTKIIDVRKKGARIFTFFDVFDYKLLVGDKKKNEIQRILSWVNIFSPPNLLDTGTDVLKEFFRIARETVFISVSKGNVFTENRHILDTHEQKGWRKISPMPDGMYKWVRDLR